MDGYNLNRAFDHIKDFYLEQKLTSEEHNNLMEVMARALTWHIKTKISDPVTLAALAISGDYEWPMTAEEINQIREFFFPSNPVIETVNYDD